MKKLYITAIALALATVGFAQTPDSLLRRQLELERDFNPTLMDADKINSLPALREPFVRKANTNYSAWAGRITPPLEIALPRPGSIMTEIPFNKRRGYLSFNAGNYTNLDGAFGYRIVENEKNNLVFTFIHNSTNGDTKYNQPVEPKENKTYFMDNEGALSYRHRGDALTFNTELSYFHSLFNYYGNRFSNTPLYNDENQSLGVFNAKVGIDSHETDFMNYKGYILFRNFSTKYGETLDVDGIKGNEISAMVGLEKPFGDTENKVGIDGNISSAFYSGDLDNYFLITAAPYFLVGNRSSFAKLGADVLFQNYNGSKIRVAPNVKLQWGVNEHSSLYANIHGGFKDNTFLEMIQESRYIRPYGSVLPSFTILDMEAGIKIGEVDGFRFDIFGGYKKTDDEHFLVLNNKDITAEGTPGPYREVLKPIYGDISHAHIGGMIQSNFWAPLDLSLRIKKNFYNLDEVHFDDQQIEDAKAYNKPEFEVDLRAVIKLTNQLQITANYYLAGDRWTYFDGANIKMDNINDLNAGVIYHLSDAFSVNLRANNLLSQKYDIWYGHPAQRLNASGGFSFRF